MIKKFILIVVFIFCLFFFFMFLNNNSNKNSLQDIKMNKNNKINILSKKNRLENILCTIQKKIYLCYNWQCNKIFNELKKYKIEKYINDIKRFFSWYDTKYFCTTYNNYDKKVLKIILFYYLTNAYKCNQIIDYVNFYNNYLRNISCVRKKYKYLFIKKEINYITEKNIKKKEFIYKINLNEK